MLLIKISGHYKALLVISVKKFIYFFRIHLWLLQLNPLKVQN